MTFPEFPLAERELTRRGRSMRVYIVRTFVLLLVLLALLTQLDYVNRMDAETIGAMMKGIATFFQMAVLVLVAPALSAGLLAQEKHDRTLGLLLMADLRGWDIFGAKFLSAFLEVELLILSTLPVLGFAAFFGGVSVPAMTLQVALLSLCAASVVSVALCCSTFSSRPAEALRNTIAALALWFAVTLYLDFRPGWPPVPEPLNILAAAARVDELFFIDPWYAWPAASLTALIGLLAAALAIWRLPAQAYEKPARRQASKRRMRFLGERLVPILPEARLMAASLAPSSTSRSDFVLRPIMTVLILAIAIVPVAGTLLVLMMLYYQTIHAIAQMRSSGALDDLLTTPVSRIAMARALVRASVERSIVFFPALLAMGAPPVICFLFTMERLNSPRWFDGFAFHQAPSHWLLALSFMFHGLAQFRGIVAFVTCAGINPGKPVVQTFAALFISVFLYAGACWILLPLSFNLLAEGPPASVHALWGMHFMLLSFGLFYMGIAWVSTGLLQDWMLHAAAAAHAEPMAQSRTKKA